MTPTGILLGIDGGGSKTLALLADLDGNLLSRGEGSASNYHSVGIPAAYAALDEAYANAASKLSEKRPVHALCLGMAGVDRPEDHAIIQRWVHERFPNLPSTIVNDAHLVLAAGTPAGWGIGVISGTGSIAFGRHPRGNLARAGGWGHLLGDEGSGYSLGLAALQAIAKADDGRGPATRLTELVLAEWGLHTPQDLIGYVYRPEVTRTLIAGLARVVEAAALQDDRLAAEILSEAGRELALAAASVARQLELTGEIPCALAGSLLVKSLPVQSAFRQAATEMGLALHPLTPVPEPAQGAIRLAKALV